VEGICAAAVTERGQLTALDVVTGLGWLSPVHVERWRRGGGRPLEPYAVPVERIIEALGLAAAWARSQGLTRDEAVYLGTDRHHTPLRFTPDGDPDVERLFATHWVREPVREPSEPAPATPASAAPGPARGDREDLVVIDPTRDWVCAECGDVGDLLRMDGGAPHCLACCDLDHLVFLPRGDTALTRRARSGSTLSAVVVRWSRPRRRYERQGVLVEPAALERAEELCLADADVRARRRERAEQRRLVEDAGYQDSFAAEILRRYPGCPPARAEAIARHAGERSSGRVGRTAAAKAFDPRMIELAVVASVRHEDTDYDGLLMAGVDRADARHRIRDAVDAVLERWRGPLSTM
jgi:hypothetical protein